MLCILYIAYNIVPTQVDGSNVLCVFMHALKGTIPFSACTNTQGTLYNTYTRYTIHIIQCLIFIVLYINTMYNVHCASNNVHCVAYLMRTL